MNTSEQIIELIGALHKFQGQVGRLTKSAENPFFKSSYAPLNEVLDVIREPLQLNGLCFVQFPTGEGGLTTRVMHTSGQWMEDTVYMKPVKNDPQGFGSVISYEKRYSLISIFGLNDGDDDANHASTSKENKELDINIYECPTCGAVAKIKEGTSKQGKPYKGLSCTDVKEHFFWNSSPEYISIVGSDVKKSPAELMNEGRDQVKK